MGLPKAWRVRTGIYELDVRNHSKRPLYPGCWCNPHPWRCHPAGSPKSGLEVRPGHIDPARAVIDCRIFPWISRYRHPLNQKAGIEYGTHHH